MSRVRGWVKQLRAVVRRDAVERELDEELEFHIAMETEKNIRGGMAPAAARRAAVLAFNGVERTRERVREARWTRVWEDAVADVLHALRTLRRRPGFTLLAVLTLALGIGANSALFGLLDAVVFRLPAGVPSTDRLVWADNGGSIEELAYPDYGDLRDAVTGTVELAAYESAGMGLALGDEVLRAAGQLVSGNFFDVLGMLPAHGRLLQPHDDDAAAAPAIVLGHALWRDRFGGSAGMVGRDVRLNGHIFTVVGIAPEGFKGLDITSPADVFVPIATQPLAMPRGRSVLELRDWPLFRVFGRLRSGVDAARAQAALTVAAAGIEAAAPERMLPLRPDVGRMRGSVRLDRAGGLLALVGVAALLTGLVLLVACANVANLQLARGFARRREIGVRIAIGAGRGRLVRLLLAEALVLAVAAAALGTLVAFWGASFFQARFRGPLAPLDVTPDTGTLAFTIVLAMTTALLFGLVPAWRASAPQVTPLLKGGESGGRPRRLQRMLVIAQVGGSLVLLVCAGLLVRRGQHARDAEVGFDAASVLSASFDLAAHGHDTDAVRRFYGTLREALEGVPGVMSVSAPGFAPFGSGAALMGSSREEQAPGGSTLGDRVPVVGIGVAGDYFATLGITPLRGRAIEERDIAADVRVAVISESLARRMWPGEDPLGRRIRPDGREDAAEVIGVVPDVVLSDPFLTTPQIYLPWTQHYQLPVTSLLVRASGDPLALVPAVREAVARIDPTLPVFDIRTLDRALEERLAFSRGIARIVGGFAALALLLAALGLYGVVVFTITGRTREIGVRMALGARPRTVVAEFVNEGLRLALFGLLIGVLAAAAAGRVLAGVVDGLPVMDLQVVVAVACTLLGVTLLASWIPARRAARVDPLDALRSD